MMLGQVADRVIGKMHGKIARSRLSRLLRGAGSVGGDFEAVITLAYRTYLGRSPDPAGLRNHINELRRGTPIAQVLTSIKTSGEADDYWQTVEKEKAWQVQLLYRTYLGSLPDSDTLNTQISLLRKGLTLSQVAAVIEASEERSVHLDREAEWAVRLVYRHFLGRDADGAGLRKWVAAIRQGMPASKFSELIEGSAEGLMRREQARQEIESYIRLVYQHYLGRDVEDEGLRTHSVSIQGGLLFSQFAQTIGNSTEAQERRRRTAIADKLSDGDFLIELADIIFHGRGPQAAEIESWKAFLNEDAGQRSELISGAIGSYLESRNDKKEMEWDPRQCLIMGTDQILTADAWVQKAEHSQREQRPALQSLSSVCQFKHSGEFRISAIASLYKGGAFIERFLQNITSQSAFDKSELIIIDADSPDGEHEIIAKYQERYPNIVYKRINYRLGIYDAWNVAVGMARGRYLTNTNMDDLRRSDSFEIQAAALDRHSFVDVVYQDFFYSFDGSMSFDEVAQVGFKSQLPIITPHNLLKFNSPHNAPMWRKTLHDELGLFDISFKSAGDWEFWLRCLVNGKQFLKINIPHVVYFQNPEGISTQANTRGVEEGHRVLRRYSPLLISSELRLSRADFARLLGSETPSAEKPYVLVQRRLNQLAAQYRSRTVV